MFPDDSRYPEGPRHPDEERLVAALTAEAEQIHPSDDALSLIRARLTEEPSEGRGPATPRRRRGQAVVAGALALGLSAAATLFVITGGLHRDTALDPAQTPTVSTPSAPTSGAPFEPSAPRTSWTVYRVGYDSSNPSGLPVLREEEVPATPPYEPRQALDEMFSTPPADPLGVDGEQANRVASVRLTDQAIVLDMAAVSQRRPSGMVSDSAVAQARLQSWVLTLQDAYGTDKPVLVTLQGKPFTLLHALDTAGPINRSDSIKIRLAHEIFLPRAAASVTSPVALQAGVPRGELRWWVEDLHSGKTVFDETLDNQSSPRTVGYTPDLAPGSYRFTVTLVHRPQGVAPFERSVDFDVSGPAPSTGSSPVTDVPIQAVAVTPVLFPSVKGRSLVQEWRPRTTSAAALATVLSASAASPGVDRAPLLPGSQLTSVTEQDDQITVDFADLGSNRAPNPSIAALRSQAIVATLQAYTQSTKAVLITVRDIPTPLYGLGDDTNPLQARSIATTKPSGLFAPTTGTVLDNPLTLVGRVPQAGAELTWYLIDPISNETRFAGRAPIEATSLVYALSVEVPAGEYRLQIVRRHGASDNQSTVYDVSVR